MFAGLGCIVQNKVARVGLSTVPASSTVVTSLLMFAKIMMTHVADAAQQTAFDKRSC